MQEAVGIARVLEQGLLFKRVSRNIILLYLLNSHPDSKIIMGQVNILFRRQNTGSTIELFYSNFPQIFAYMCTHDAFKCTRNP